MKYLRHEDGLTLAKSLAGSSAETVQQLALALTPMRAGNYVLPTIEVFRATLIRMATCLPQTLALLTQFQEGRLQSADCARLHEPQLRIFVGDSDRDLRQRPRLFVVETRDPFNLVQRPRRTANARALIAALQLIRNSAGSNIA